MGSTWRVPSNTPSGGFKLSELTADLPALFKDANRPNTSARASDGATETQSSRFWEAVLSTLFTHLEPQRAFRMHSQQPPSNAAADRLRRVDTQFWGCQQVGGVVTPIILLHCEYKGANVVSLRDAAEEAEAQAQQACEAWCQQSRTGMCYALTSRGTLCMIWQYWLVGPVWEPMWNVHQNTGDYEAAPNYIDAGDEARSEQIMQSLAYMWQHPPAERLVPPSYLYAS